MLRFWCVLFSLKTFQVANLVHKIRTAMKMLRKLQYVVDFIVESLTFDIILCFCIHHTHMNEQAEPLQLVFPMSFGHKWKTLQKKTRQEENCL